MLLFAISCFPAQMSELIRLLLKMKRTIQKHKQYKNNVNTPTAPHWQNHRGGEGVRDQSGFRRQHSSAMWRHDETGIWHGRRLSVPLVLSPSTIQRNNSGAQPCLVLGSEGSTKTANKWEISCVYKTLKKKIPTHLSQWQREKWGGVHINKCAASLEVGFTFLFWPADDQSRWTSVDRKWTARAAR